MSDDVKLPTTVEEYQRERRLVFSEGVYMGASNPEILTSAVAEHARHRFPIRKQVQRVVRYKDRSGNPWEVKVEGGQFYSRPADCEGAWALQYATLTPENILSLADLLNNPTETVDE